MVFILHFVNTVNHIDWFVNVKLSFYPGNKFHLIMMYGSFKSVLFDNPAEFGLLIFY